MKTRFSLFIVVLLLCGCGSAARGPSVSLINLRFEDASALDATATFTLRLSNETPQPVQITGEDHKIYLNGLYVGSGMKDQAVTVPRLGAVTHDVTVHLNNLARATRVKSMLETKSFEYRIVSVFYGKNWFGRTRSESAGKLELKDIVPEPALTNPPSALLKY